LLLVCGFCSFRRAMKMTELHVLLPLVLLLSDAFGYPCTYSWGGNKYDASPLANNQTDYHFNVQGTDFWLNMCRPVVTDLCGTDSAACQQWDPQVGHASLGSANTAVFNPPNIPGVNDQGYTVQFTGGDPIPGQNANRTMEIDFICSPGSGLGIPSFSGEDPPLHYNMQWRTQYACALSSPCTYSTCDACANDQADDCVWCLDSSSCLEGPLDSNSSCSSWVTNPKYCPAPCSAQTNCTGCTEQNGCGWCLDSSVCENLPVNSTMCADLIAKPVFCPSDLEHTASSVKVRVIE